MQNKKIIILIILGIAAVVSLFRGMSAPSRPGQGGILKLTDEAEVAPVTRNAKKTAYSSCSRDPFLASSTSIKGYGGPALSGIMWDTENPMAVINGKVVKIGDKIGGNSVVDIKQNKVILNDGAKDFELKPGQ